ncbi:thiolase family protein [Desulfomonile tiedjei]|uniref:Acetyl-CoA acetyltransferase n=1 Tax=Desulfomonile tiedjei (strain ATCC 49306 / DSM 6799 / DCB-1) TaxID=706587 RepID=I4C7T1_DESTA|nr:thiolase family protein [Desulfomonile tiedjei]AFM25622.1 acetyl-CoA acetyltransferase [Desulfomonile tiedjei DSM 6799]
MKARKVVLVDAIRTAFGRAGEKGVFWNTRADDMVVKVIRELMRRNPTIDPEMIDENAWGVFCQEKDQGLTLGRTSVILAGLPVTTAGYSIDRMCAGGMSAITTAASAVALGAADVVIAGGVEHMGHHPMGATADPNPRFLTDKLVDQSAMSMGETAENLHDMFPEITKEMADEYSLHCQARANRAIQSGKIGEMIVPMTVYTKSGWTVADKDEQPRPETTIEGLAKLKTPFRVMGKVTAGNSSGLNDGAAGCILMAKEKAEELGIEPKMELKAFAYAGVKPEIMGIGPIPATHKALKVAGLTIDDIGLIELNEAFAVQAVAFMKEFGLQFPEDPKLNIYGGAIAFGHPLASSGVRLACHLMHGFAEHPEAKYGLTTMCVGLGQGGTVIWKNLQRNGKDKEEHEHKDHDKEEPKEKEKKKKKD